MSGASKADVLCLEKKLLLSDIKRDEWWPTSEGAAHETSFAFHIDTHVVKWFEGEKTEGDAWKATFYSKKKWVTGTCDWSWVHDSYYISIDDLKTGRWPVSAKDNKQLLTYAMPFWLKMGKPLKCAIHLSITQWERYPLHGLPKRNWARATGLDMLMHLQDLKHALENPQEASANKDNCRFCDAKNNCPTFLTSGITF